ncbi:MAG: SGNH/GDSL hydrolase family protein [Actinomycetota bacterium]|nr:SGNH/GDSL hydrolase family protein [Actinomycetota bacterium]
MLRRCLIGFIALLVALGLLTGVEVLIALRRDYLPTEQALELDGTFGGPGGDELTFVVLGDSTAAGVGAGAPADAYPQVLARRLADDGYRVDLRVFGVSGARIEDVRREQLDIAIEADPDLVLIAIGANDTTHLTPLDDVRGHTTFVLDKVQAETGADIVVAGAPDMRAPAFLQPLRWLSGWRGRQVAGAIEGAGTEAGVAVVELAKETGHLFESDPDRYHSADDFHPSADGYELWANAIYPVLKETLDR